MKSIALFVAVVVSAQTARAENFPKPRALVPNVAFWKRVYVEWSVNDIALHDEQDLGIVYRVVRVPPRGQKGPDGLGRGEKVAKATNELEVALRSLAKKNPKDASKLDGLEKEVFENLQHVTRADKYTRLSTIRAQNGLRERFVQGYVNSGLYEQKISSELRAAGLPDELIAVAFVESLFYTGAKSKVGAAGVWQFMSYTGREYMHLNDVIDERYDPVLATEAAAKYLKTAKRELGEWPLIVTSYNYGRGGMRALATAAGTKDFDTILAVSKNKRFGFAARNYYASFLAVVEILKEPHPAIRGVQKKGAWQYDVVRLPFPMTTPQLVAAAGIERAQFEVLNPALTDAAIAGRVVLPTGMSLRVPKGQGGAVVAKWSGMPGAERKKALALAAGTHSANGKQTIEQIAKSYGVAVDTLASTLGVDPSHKPAKGTKVPVPAKLAKFTLLPEARGLAVPNAPVLDATPDVMVASAPAVATTPAPTPTPAPPVVAAAPVVEPAPVVATATLPPGPTVTVGRVRVLPAERPLPGVDLVSAARAPALPAVDAIAGDPGADAPWVVVPAPVGEDGAAAERPTS